jgi:hypothetical protein
MLDLEVYAFQNQNQFYLVLMATLVGELLGKALSHILSHPFSFVDSKDLKKKTRNLGEERKNKTEYTHIHIDKHELWSLTYFKKNEM